MSIISASSQSDAPRDLGDIEVKPIPLPIRQQDCNWYHVMDVPGIGVTPGLWDLRSQFDEYIGHVDLKGKTVLDMGTASGFLSFASEWAGAREVVSFDIDIGERQKLLPFKNSSYYRDHAAWAERRSRDFDAWKRAYWCAHHAYGSKARVVYGDIYNLPSNLGLFDVVLCCSVLEHMADPISAIASMARHAADRLVLAVWIPNLEEKAPIAWFLGSADRPEAAGIFWAYSLKVYQEIFAMLGFEIESSLTGSFKLSHGAPSPKTALVARRK